MADRLIQYLARRSPSVETEAAALDSFLGPGAVCCDVGAEYGLYTLTFAARVGQRGRVLSFEPLPGPNKFLRGLVRALGASNVVVRSDALGDRARTGTMSLPKRRGVPVHGRAFLADEADGLGPNAEFAEEDRLAVTVSTLDAVVEHEGCEKVDFIKVDVEGYEPAVLRGARRTIERFQPVLMVEIEDRHLEKFGDTSATVVEFLTSRGYEMSTLIDGRWQSVDKVTDATRNYLFTPA
jgi:FkbM family methyltransferase